MKKTTLICLVFFMAVTVFAGETDKIGLILKMQEKLELSEVQQKEIMDLHTGLEKIHINQEAKIKLAEIDLKELYHGEIKDLKKIEKKIHEIAKLKAEMEFNQVESYFKAEKILNDDQKKKFYAMGKKMHHKHAMEKEKHIKIMLKESKGELVEEDVHFNIDMDAKGHHKKVIVKKTKDDEGNIWITKDVDGKVTKMKMTEHEDMSKWMDKEKCEISLDICKHGESGAFFIKEKPGETFEYVIKKGEDGIIHILERNEEGELVEVKEGEGEHKIILKCIKEKKIKEE